MVGLDDLSNIPVNSYNHRIIKVGKATEII